MSTMNTPLHSRALNLISVVLIVSIFIMALFTPDLSRSELEAKYAQSPSQFVMVEGLRVHYRDTGPRGGQTIVLLHGFGSSLQTWDAWVGALEQNFRVVRLDLAGFGLTGASPDKDYSDAADVARLDNFLNALGVKDSIVIGHSMGGRIAWNYASTHANRVKRLILMAPDGFPVPGQRIGDKPYDAGPVANVIKYCMPKFLVKKTLEPAFYDPSVISENLIDRYYDLLRAPTVRQAILDRMAQTVNSDPLERLRRITAPTLILWGEWDQMIPSTNSKDYKNNVTDAQVVILSKAGHLLQEENAERALPYILDFIKP